MRRSFLRWAVAPGIAIAMLAALVPAHATTCEALTVADLAKRAELVVHGTCESATAVWNVDRTRIDTVVTVRVTEMVKGRRSRRITFRCPGGTRDGKIYYIQGMPRIEAGQEVVLALSSLGGNGVRVPVGLAQGAFRVVDGVAIRDPRGVNRVAPAGAPPPGECRERIPLGELLAVLRANAR